ELVPNAARVGVLANSVTSNTARETEAAARALGLQIQVFNAGSSREIDAVFSTFGQERPDALFVTSGTLFHSRRVQSAHWATYHKVPASYSTRQYVEVGGLMSYGTSATEAFRQTGIYTGRILKGTKPADLPVVQSTKFELVINAQTARMLGLTVP